MRKEFRSLASIGEARRIARELMPAPDATTVALREADGRVLAQDVDAPTDVPGFDRSTMDGYAVRAADTMDDGPLTVLGAVEPGVEPDVAVGTGEAAEIATGAVMPDGADAVVKVERTDRDGDRVDVGTVTRGDNVARAGFDVPRGARALRAGRHLGPRELGLLAALGVDEVPVRGRLTVVVAGTGDEVVPPDEPLGPGEIHDVNSYSVADAARDAGADVTSHGVLADDADDVAAALEDLAARHDAVVTSGSTSASEGDVIHRLVDERGELVQHGVDLKPGKPTVLGALDGTPVFGLPGNPISALTVFRTLIAPALRDVAGLPERRDITDRAAVARDLPTHGGRTRLLPVGLVECPDRGLLCHELDKGSGATTSLAHADGYVVVDGRVERLERDDAVDVHLLDAGVRPPSAVVAGPPDRAVEDLLPVGARWIDAGSTAAARKLRDGVVDVAGIRDARDALEDLGLRNAVLIGGFERDVGICGDSDGRRVAVADDRGLVSDDAEVVRVPSPRGVAPAVANGDAAAGISTRAQARAADLPFEALDRERYDLLFRRERLAKPAVEACREDLAAAVEDREGYRATSETGERVREWSG